MVTSNICFAEGYYNLLKEIDSLRSIDPLLFSEKFRAIGEHKSEFDREESDFYRYLEGYHLAYRGRLAEALSLQKQLSQQAITKEMRFRALLTVINIEAINQNWNGGLKSLNKALEVLPAIREPKLEALALGIISVFYNQLGQYELGLEYSRRLKNSFDDPRSLCIGELHQFEALLNLASTESTLANSYKSALTLCQKAEERLLELNAHILFGRFLLETKKTPHLAAELFALHYPQVNKVGYAPVILAYQSLQAKAYWQLGMSEPAFELAQAVSQSPAAANTLEALIRANKVLFDYHSANGNSEAALAAYIKYAEADKAYLDEVKTKTLAFQLAQHQSMEQQNKINLLDEKNKVLMVQRQLDKVEQFNSRIMIVVLFCVILGLGTWGWNSLKAQRRLKQMAEYDSLTGLFSRGHFYNLSESAISHALKLGAPVSCVLFDVDRFKGINDKYGHSTGDWALKQVAKQCRNQLREYEIFGRIGGEEFCLILPECDLESAYSVAEKLRKTLAESDTLECGYQFALTASFGVTESLFAGYSLDNLLAQADKAMYKAKHNGRNQVQVFCPASDVAGTKTAPPQVSQATLEAS
ncbi:GGDEF domain-containing protein [Shewanella submarina]|uniref:sensor domain-containing diguanylate cyclase n=1 Tax=Shewanella submarina TaxID=2016376 RepID=UPI00200F20FE|nr:GGDEF domain-containing protein [Shewanella submarina]MCL1036775.1 GGDEF domain-containing protein [Shewanella submarina]